MSGVVAPRIATLDVIRGVAVMGILVANLPAFALPKAAYFSPLAWGGSTGADLWVWFATFVLIEGKMRGLFTLLFGASMLLVIDGARARRESAAAVHFRRTGVLLAIGCLHFYLLWWGDILHHYALVAAVAFLFVRLSTRWLIVAALAILALQWVSELMAYLSMLASAARDSPAAVATWVQFAGAFGVPPATELTGEIAGERAGFVAAAVYRWHHNLSPLGGLAILGPQTLGTMLLGMAAYRSGFLTGAWPRARYRRWAIAGLAVALPAYVALALHTLAQGFDQRAVFAASILLAEPLRIFAILGYAALLILLIRPGGWLTTRVAAVGRAAFTNYLGTTLMMTFIFSGWGLGQVGSWQRSSLYLLVPLAWGIMLAWSKPWLDRYRYGPLEWAWRTLARFAVQPMRGAANATT